MLGREKDEIKLGDYPTSSSKYEKWKDKAHSKIIAASGRPLKCKEWLDAIGFVHSTEEIADIDENWQNFDAKLTSALLEKAGGELEQQILLP
jgi:hypothetical protein